MILVIQVYNLFRQLGLRHVLVVPRASRVIGIITRKDLLIEVLWLQTFSYSVVYGKRFLVIGYICPPTFSGP